MERDSADARSEDPLTKPVAQLWAKMFAQLEAGKLDALAAARQLHALPESAGEHVTVSDFADLLKAELIQLKVLALDVDRADLKSEKPLSRSNACEWMYRIRTSNGG